MAFDEVLADRARDVLALMVRLDPAGADFAASLPPSSAPILASCGHLERRKGRADLAWLLCRNMYDKGAKPDLAIAEIASRQHGVVSANQLYAVGLDRDGVYHRARTGRLHPIHRGVYGVGHRALSAEARCIAAVLAVGSGPDPAEGAHPAVFLRWGASISHRGAACLWGLLKFGEASVDVTIQGTGGRRRRKGIRVHRSLTLRPGMVTLRQGIPVTTPARTISDLRRVVGREDRSGLVSPRELRRAIRQANYLGLSIDEEARKERSRSDLELDFQALCRRFDLPAPEVNVRVGPHVVDFYWRQRGLVVETDGYAAHRGRVAFEDDHGRDFDLRARGLDVIRLAEKQLNEEPGRVAEVVGAALRVGADAARSA